MVIDMSYFSKVLKKILIFVLTLLGVIFGLKLACFYIPFLIGFIISLIIEPIVKFVTKKTSLTRKVSAIIVLVIIFTILISLITWGIITLVSESTNLLQGLNNNIEKIYSKMQRIIDGIKFNIPEEVVNIFEKSLSSMLDFTTKSISDFLTGIIQFVTSLPIIGIYIVITILSTYFICSDKIYILDQLEHHFPKIWFKKFVSKIKKIISALGNYLKAESILILISFLEVLIGLCIFKWVGFNIKYPLLAALGIGFVDALPILGSGTVILPWAVISGVNGDIKLAIALVILYVIVLVVRQILEPKIVSNKIGTHPIFTLIAMYTGFKITGIIGLFIGPIMLIIFQSIFENMIDNGILKTIFEKNN